jgi:signal transduction histidine kinase
MRCLVAKKPLGDDPKRPGDDPKRIDGDSPYHTVMGSIRRVLLVGIESEDHAAITTRLSQLETAVEVLSEPDAASALSSLQTLPESIDCIVSAAHLAGMDGIALSRERTRQLASPTAPFVLFVTDGSEELAATALEAGVSGYVRRGTPDAVERLVERVRRAFESTHPGGDTKADGAAADVRQRELQRERERLEDIRHALSHDLRSPLNVATGYLQYLSDGVDTSSGGVENEAIENGLDALDRIDSFLDDMNALVQQGRPAVSADPVDLASAAQSVWADLDTGEASLRGLDGSRPDFGTVIADRERLRGLLGELYRNAIDHSEPGVTVEVGALPDGFYVEDDGPGIRESRRDDTFRIGMSDREGHAGFGLARVRHIAAAHHWRVAIADASTGGTRVEMTGVERTN